MEVLPGPLPDGRRSGGDDDLGSRPTQRRQRTPALTPLRKRPPFCRRYVMEIWKNPAPSIQKNTQCARALTGQAPAPGNNDTSKAKHWSILQKNWRETSAITS